MGDLYAWSVLGDMHEYHPEIRIYGIASQLTLNIYII